MSSSSEEDLSKFNEAADVELFNNSLYSNNKDVAENIVEAPIQPSLRYLTAAEARPTDSLVTPGFQKHAAIKLMKILDSDLLTAAEAMANCQDVADADADADASLCKKETAADSGGVRLFGASAAFLLSCNIIPDPPVRRRKRGRTHWVNILGDDSSDSNDCSDPETSGRLVAEVMDSNDRLAACAVSPDWILNGDAVKGWAPPFKNKEAIQGECTPDMSNVTSKKKKHKDKRKKARIEEPATIDTVIEKTEKLSLKRSRGKRGKKSKEKKEKQSAEPLQLNPNHEAEELVKKKKKKKKKRSHKGDDPSLLPLEDAYKLYKRKRRLEKAAKKGDVEDEGFGSDPTKSERKVKPRKFGVLVAVARRIKRDKATYSGKSWRSTMEGLSEGLENLSTTNEKED